MYRVDIHYEQVHYFKYLTSAAFQHVRAVYKETRLDSETLEQKILSYHHQTAFAILKHAQTYPNEAYADHKLTNMEHEILDIPLLKAIIITYLKKRGAEHIHRHDMEVTATRIKNWSLTVIFFPDITPYLANIPKDIKKLRKNLRPTEI